MFIYVFAIEEKEERKIEEKVRGGKVRGAGRMIGEGREEKNGGREGEWWENEFPSAISL